MTSCLVNGGILVCEFPRGFPLQRVRAGRFKRRTLNEANEVEVEEGSSSRPTFFYA
jgi:hypothetical protein